uniref:Uncharacterized protein n=1 Tax=Neobodo designis TaxID=312471 RepID=A0A7S1Q3D2_NEODS|mmetsp:Transcript_31581/g.97558  ORF Transcript_31581/g.97558 Transcript_31581/m.97558 type:complete len:610 (+) Transcript_31581:97-1926(+)|eukprot:CAMPEP_0174839252 /NCGR_PEP_ID=MMETSP1114-20130205/7917_1 /TAXON_ID=312471 /ORGANISM="Neobodo designis, Strain CCAP 1951/1" /LENGTH=609 /DNA_ID=CAMNT_0016073373 /DNA_START=94 /DNA_END=1923 /DNA_ORIENTATION=+
MRRGAARQLCRVAPLPTAALGGRVIGASAVASSALPPVGPSTWVRGFHQWRISNEDVRRFEEELRMNQEAIEEEKNETATEIRVESTRYVGVPPEEQAADGGGAKAAKAEPTPAAADQANTTAQASGDKTSTDATQGSADAASSSSPVPPLDELLAGEEPVTATTEVESGEFLYGGVTEADERRKREEAVRKMYDNYGVGDVAVAKGRMRFTQPEDEFAIAMQRAAAKNRQRGPYVDSKTADIEPFDVDDRRRRAVDRVPQMEEQYEGNETSFRRLPRGFKIPEEYHLRHMYPMMTRMKLVWEMADCVDGDARDIYERNANGIKHGIIYPPDFDESKTYPVMVALSDARGMEYDVEDLCANFFERDEFLKGLQEQQWIILFPCINSKQSQGFPMEAVVARFCDWASARYNCEHGKPHLFGRGLGGHLALRTTTYHKAIAMSVIAIVGRLAAPFRPLERPQKLIHNMEGTHSLVIVPGQTRKVDWMYKWKALMDLNYIRPPTRFIHFAEVMDAQVVYAINPIEFLNYLLYFRRNPLHSSLGAADPSARQEAEQAEERASWDAEKFRDYSDAKGDPLGTVTYEWIDGRSDADKAMGQQSGKTYVAEDGSVA